MGQFSVVCVVAPNVFGHILIFCTVFCIRKVPKETKKIAKVDHLYCLFGLCNHLAVVLCFFVFFVQQKKCQMTFREKKKKKCTSVVPRFSTYLELTL